MALDQRSSIALSGRAYRGAILRRLLIVSVVMSVPVELAGQPVRPPTLAELRHQAAALERDIARAANERAGTWRAVLTARNNWSSALQGANDCPSQAIRQTAGQLQHRQGALENQFHRARGLVNRMGAAGNAAAAAASRAWQAQRSNDARAETPARREEVRLRQILLGENRQLADSIRDLESDFKAAIAVASNYRQQCANSATTWELILSGAGSWLSTWVGPKSNG